MMTEKEVLQALVGWRCPCCNSIIAPTEKSCIYCSGIVKKLMLINDPKANVTMFCQCTEKK